MSESKVLWARYFPREVCFRIPENIDLEDKTKVANYDVRWETLYITLVDGTTIEIEKHSEIEDDGKYPFETVIEDE